jgi:hypothetical protein
MQISAPISTEGDIDEVNRGCARLIEDAIRREPAHWGPWFYGTMASIGLLPEGEAKQLVKVGGAWLPEPRRGSG